MKIKLYTYQNEAAVDILKSTGVLKITKNTECFTHPGRDKSINHPFDYPYQAMIDKMKEKLPPSDPDITYPLWAWYKMRGKYQPIKHFDKIHEGLYRITFEIDSSLVLLSDFDMFCYLISGGLYFAYDKEEEEELSSHLFDDVKVYFYPNLERMFDYKHNKNSKFTPTYQAETIQATFWKLELRQVIEIKKV